jgi:hypothetical protein
MWGRRAAVLAWLAFAFVAWNVMFDRGNYVAGVQFAQTSIELHQQGRQPLTIADGYQPLVRASAARATLGAAVILVAGLALIFLTSTRVTANSSPADADAVHRRT